MMSLARTRELLKDCRVSSLPPLARVDGGKAAEELRGHAIRRFDLFAHRRPRSLDLRRDKDDDEERGESGHDEIETGAEASRQEW